VGLWLMEIEGLYGGDYMYPFGQCLDGFVRRMD
jgi:hypothetical protein